MNKQNHDLWWQHQPEELKLLLAKEETPDRFWQKLDENTKSLIHDYCILKANGGSLDESSERSMLIEIVSEIADHTLCSQTGKPIEDMCNTDGEFLEQHQDRFNKIYDEIERQLSHELPKLLSITKYDQND